MITAWILILSFAATAPPPKAVADDDLESFASQTDTNMDGRITLDEFRIQSRKASTRPSDVMIDDLFRSYDLDSDGFVTTAELEQLRRRGEREIARSLDTHRK